MKQLNESKQNLTETERKRKSVEQNLAESEQKRKSTEQKLAESEQKRKLAEMEAVGLKQKLFANVIEERDDSVDLDSAGTDDGDENGNRCGKDAGSVSDCGSDDEEDSDSGSVMEAFAQKLMEIENS